MSPLLTVEDVAGLLNVSRRAVYRLVAGGLPYVRLDRRSLRFRERYLESWIDRRVDATASSAGRRRAG